MTYLNLFFLVRVLPSKIFWRRYAMTFYFFFGLLCHTLQKSFSEGMVIHTKLFFSRKGQTYQKVFLREGSDIPKSFFRGRVSILGDPKEMFLKEQLNFVHLSDLSLFWFRKFREKLARKACVNFRADEFGLFSQVSSRKGSKQLTSKTFVNSTFSWVKTTTFR